MPASSRGIYDWGQQRRVESGNRLHEIVQERSFGPTLQSRDNT
jgi:hypothetical protein